jgi:hypothetical protein
MFGAACKLASSGYPYKNFVGPPGKPILSIGASYELASQAGRGGKANSQAGSRTCIS